MAKKLIKVANRCQILTSRGYCLGPISYPFYEEIQYILPMISKGATVIEVLSNGQEVELNKDNFDKDNLNNLMQEKAKESETRKDLVEEQFTQKPEKVEVKTNSNNPNQNNGNRQQYQNNKNFNNKNGKNNNNKHNQNKPQQTKPDVFINNEIEHTQPKKIVEDVLEEA